MWLGHYTPGLLITSIGVTVIAAATGDQLGVAGDVAVVVWIIAAFSLFIGGHYHDSRLCGRCVAAAPLDPQAAIERWRPALWWAHKTLWMSLATFAAVGWFIWLGQYHHVPWWAWIPTVPAALVYAGVFISARQHSRLYPWCPWCHWNDGGDEEIAPDVPAPTVSR
jgi:hypothetical protein